MLSILLVLFSFMSFTSSKTQGLQICETPAQVDADLARLYTFGNSGRSFPENVSDYASYCKETERLLAILENYSKNCLGPNDVLIQSTLKILAYTIRKELRNLCKAAVASNTAAIKLSRRQLALLRSSRCTNELASEAQFCIDQAIDYLAFGSTFNASRTRLMYVCCNFQVYESCLRTQLTGSEAALRMPDHCNERNADTTIAFIDSLQNSMINFMCGDYAEDSDRCASMLARKAPKGFGKKFKSLVLPLVKLVDETKTRKLEA